MYDSVIQWTVVRQAPLTMGFPKQEYWSMLPVPSSGAFSQRTGLFKEIPFVAAHDRNNCPHLMAQCVKSFII